MTAGVDVRQMEKMPPLQELSQVDPAKMLVGEDNGRYDSDGSCCGVKSGIQTLTQAGEAFDRIKDFLAITEHKVFADTKDRPNVIMVRVESPRPREVLAAIGKVLYDVRPTYEPHAVRWMPVLKQHWRRLRFVEFLRMYDLQELL